MKQTLLWIGLFPYVTLALANTLLSQAQGAVSGFPCQSVEMACKAQGYAVHGAKKGKNFFKDCMNPILSGKSVPGVKPNPADVKACAALMKHAHHVPRKKPAQK